MSKIITRFVVNYYILPIDANASARQNVVITTFCNVTTFWVATVPCYANMNVTLFRVSVNQISVFSITQQSR